MNGFKVTVTTTTMITENVVTRLIDSAIALGGSSLYWIHIGKTLDNVGDSGFKYYSDYVLRGRGVPVCDREQMEECASRGEDNSGVVILDREAVQKGLDLMAALSPEEFRKVFLSGGDAHTADVFMQYCVLKELVYE